MEKDSERSINIHISSGVIIKTVVVLAVCWALYYMRDLVVVILPTPCCSNSKAVGRIRQVLSRTPLPFTRCDFCGERRPSTGEVLLDDDFVYGRYRLKRIPPLEELDRIVREDTADV